MTQSLQQFFKDVRKTDLLTREEEIELAQKIDAGDAAARDKMIAANIRLAISIAKKFQNRGSDLEDLIQESTIGLMKAVDRFDWRKGFKFSTYASWWVKQAVQRHISTHTRTIRIPSHASGLRTKIDAVIAEYKKEFSCLPSDEEIADILGVTVGAIENAQNMGRCTVSLTDPFGGNKSSDSSSEGKTLQEVLADESDSIEQLMQNAELIHVVRKSLKTLSEREEKILRLRFGIAEENEDKSPEFAITKAELCKLQERMKEV